MANNKVNYDINFNVDMSSLELLKEALNNIQTMSSQYYIKINGGKVAENQLKELKQTASQVEIAMDAAFNPKLNTMNFTQFNSVLKASGLNIQKIEEQFNTAGDSGKRAFRNLTEQIFTANTELKKTKGFIQNIGETLFNAAKWSVAYGAINNITNGIKSAWTYAISLDSALNDIRIVTGKSYEEMEKFAKSANKAAKALGTSTMDYTKGSLIYYQQGLGKRDVEARTAVSAKTANVTGQSMQEVSEELTAVWNGFQVTAKDAESYVDRLAAVAAASASDLEELSTAMSKVASSANAMGINVDQLTAQIATIESVTRQDAASIGTALKTIYSRMGDLAIGAEDEFGVALGDVSGKMKKMGIDILDQEGNMRDMGIVIEEVAAKWGTWTEAQQQAAAVALAGKRQYNNLIALFENWDMYESNKSTSQNSLGELQKQQDTYMESTKAHMQQMQAAAEGLKDALFDNKSMNAFFDVMRFGLEQLTSLVNGLGGAGNILLGVFSSLGVIWSQKIGQGIGSMLANLKSIDSISINQQARNEVLAQYTNVQEDAIEKMVSLEEDKLKYSNVLTDQEKERYNLMIKQTNELATQKELTKSMINRAGVNLASTADNAVTKGISTPIKNAKGHYDQIDLDSLSKMSDSDKNIIQTNINNERINLQQRQEDLGNFSSIRVKNASKKGATKIEKLNASTSIQKLRQNAQQQLDTNLNKESKAYKDVAASLSHLNQLEKTYGSLQASNKDVANTAIQLSKDLAQAQKEEASSLNNIEEAINTGVPKYKALTEAEKALLEEQEKLADKKRTEQRIASITSVMSAMMQFTTVIMSLINLTDVWTDESVDWGEKIKQTVMVILSLIPMIISAAKILHTQLVAQAAKTNAAVTLSLGWIGAILAGIAAIITIIATVVKLNKKTSELEKATKAYEKSNEELQEMKENVKELKTAYDDLLSTIESYQNARNSIDQLTIGTEDLTNAITDANSKALDLIQKYSLLSDYYSIDENGLINITEAGLDAIKKQQQNIIASQEMAVILKQQDNIRKKNDLINKQTLSSDSSKLTYADYDEFADFVEVKNEDGTYTQQKNTEKAKWVTETGYDYLGSTEDPRDVKFKYYLEQAQEQFIANGRTSDYFLSDQFKNLTSELSNNEDDLKKIRESIQQNIEAIDLNTNNIDLLSREYARQYLIQNNIKEYEEAQNKGDFVAAYANYLESEYAKEKPYNEAINKTINRSGNGNDIYSVNDKIKEELADFYGVDPSDIELVETKGKEGASSKIKIGDTELTQEEAIAVANKIFAARRAEEQAEKILNIQNEDNASTTLRGLTTLANGKAAILQNAYVDAIAAENSALWSEETAIAERAAGYGLITDAGLPDIAKLKALQKSSKDMTLENLKKQRKRLARSGGVTDIRTSGQITLSELSQVASGFEQAYLTGGQKGTIALQRLIAGLSGEEQANIAQAAANVDWGSLTANKDFKDQLEKLGITIDYNSSAYQNFINKMNSGNKVLYAAIDNFDSIREILAKLKEITDDISLGDIISDDDYNTLVSYNAKLSEYFVKTIDGYKAIASGDAIREASTKQFKSLSGIRTYYETLSGIGGKISNAFTVNTSGADLFNGINKLTNEVGPEGMSQILKASNINEQSYTQLLERYRIGDYTEEDTAVLQKVLSTANTIKNNTQKGLYSADAANEVYYTSDMSSLKEASENQAQIGAKEYAKIRKAWIAKYAEEFEISMEAFNALAKNLGSDEAAYKQLNFLKNYKDLVSGIEAAGKNLTGEARAKNLNEQNEILQRANTVLKNNLKAEKEALDVTISSNDYTSLYLEYLKVADHLSEEMKEKWNKLLEDAKEMENTTDQIASNLIDSVTSIVDAQTESADLQKSWNEFQAKYYKNGKIRNGFELQDNLSILTRRNLFQQNSAINLQNIETYKAALEQLNEELANTTDDNYRAKLEKQIRDYEKELQNALEAEIDNVKELYQAWSDGWDRITDKCERYTSKLEILNDIYDKQISLMKIQNKNFFNEDILNAQAENMKKMIAAAQLQYTKALERFNLATTETEKNAAKDALDSAAASYLSAVENYYEKLKSNFSEIINNLYTKLGISKANEAWERTSNYNEQYLNAADAQLNINKIRRQFQSSIDTASSIAAQIKLRNVMEEQVKILEQKDKLTQYEVDRANAVYELTLKQIALEESQRNASKMRLVRDSNGNLTYAFTQDQDATLKAQEELEQAQNNLFNIDNNEVKSQIDNYYKYQSEAQSALMEAAAAGDEERFNELKEYYYGENGIISEIQKRLPDIQNNIKNSFKDILPDGDIDSLYSYAETIKISSANLTKFKEDLEASYNNFAEEFSKINQKDSPLQVALENTSSLLETLIDDIDNDSYEKDISDISNSLKTLIPLLRGNDTEGTVFETFTNMDNNGDFVETPSMMDSMLNPLKDNLTDNNLSIAGVGKIEKGINLALKPGNFNNEIITPPNPTTPTLPKNDFEVGNGFTQNITINSSFPGVTREEEIMGAFNQFGDQAFQLSGVAKR